MHALGDLPRCDNEAGALRVHLGSDSAGVLSACNGAAK